MCNHLLVARPFGVGDRVLLDPEVASVYSANPNHSLGNFGVRGTVKWVSSRQAFYFVHLDGEPEGSVVQVMPEEMELLP